MVVDVNIIVSALIAPSGNPSAVIDAWLDGRFTLLTCAQHLAELRSTLHKPKIAELIRPHSAGRIVNEMKTIAMHVDSLPAVNRSPDPDDNYLLALAEAARADYLVTGDKCGLLGLGRHKGTRILTARDFRAVIS